MLTDDRYRRNAMRVQTIFDRSDGPGAAADAILELLGEAETDPTSATRITESR